MIEGKEVNTLQAFRGNSGGQRRIGTTRKFDTRFFK
jgi:hypothetical protein